MKPVKIGDRLGRLEAIVSVRPSDYRAAMKEFVRKGVRLRRVPCVRTGNIAEAEGSYPSDSLCGNQKAARASDCRCKAEPLGKKSFRLPALTSVRRVKILPERH